MPVVVVVTNDVLEVNRQGLWYVDYEPCGTYISENLTKLG